ncbi:NAD-dependent epimerase/dehydratase family protein [archaeon]|nr:MAG: NAD-dependent epimerase/dehydratase family protein [archaeon]
MKTVCIIGMSGKLGQYMIQHCLAKGYHVRGVYREESVAKLDKYKDKITVFPGRTSNREVVQKAVRGCDAVLVVLAPWGVDSYATNTAQAVLDFAEPHSRLVFSCGWHITKGQQDKYTWSFLTFVWAIGHIARLFRIGDLDDQVEACRRIFAIGRHWTVVRGSDLDEGESEGVPVWSKLVGDPLLASNRTRRIDFALFMVQAIEHNETIHQAPAIVSCMCESALKHATAENKLVQHK